MSNYRRANTAGGTYFFTVVSYRRQKILCDERVRSALREGIDRTRQKYPFEINAWAAGPLALSLDSAQGGCELPRTLGKNQTPCEPGLR